MAMRGSTCRRTGSATPRLRSSSIAIPVSTRSSGNCSATRISRRRSRSTRAAKVHRRRGITPGQSSESDTGALGWRHGMAELDGPARRCLPMAEWPEPDRTAWAAAHRRGGLLEDDGSAAAWAPDTSKLIASGYGRFLSFLAKTGDLDKGASPEMRVTRTRVDAYVAHLRARNHSSTVAARVLQLVRAITVMAPSIDWKWLHRIRGRLRSLATPARDDRPRLIPANALRELGTRLLQRAEERSGLSERQRALLFRDGLMIWVLCACPVR